jgi:hypothetical protein
MEVTAAHFCWVQCLSSLGTSPEFSETAEKLRNSSYFDNCATSGGDTALHQFVDKARHYPWLTLLTMQDRY